MLHAVVSAKAICVRLKPDNPPDWSVEDEDEDEGEPSSHPLALLSKKF